MILHILNPVSVMIPDNVVLDLANAVRRRFKLAFDQPIDTVDLIEEGRRTGIVHASVDEGFLLDDDHPSTVTDGDLMILMHRQRPAPVASKRRRNRETPTDS